LAVHKPQNSQQKSVPDLNVLTVAYLALKKNGFSEKKKNFQKKDIKKIPFFNATFQCGRYGIFKKNLKYFFDPEKVKKWASKVAHNRPRPFFPTVQPRPQPTAQN
jgi:hypothetical protein